jgi:hypothetical protein
MTARISEETTVRSLSLPALPPKDYGAESSFLACWCWSEPSHIVLTLPDFVHCGVWAYCRLLYCRHYSEFMQECGSVYQTGLHVHRCSQGMPPAFPVLYIFIFQYEETCCVSQKPHSRWLPSSDNFHSTYIALLFHLVYFLFVVLRLFFIDIGNLLCVLSRELSRIIYPDTLLDLRRSAETDSISSLIARFHVLIFCQCKRDNLEVVTALAQSSIYIVVFLDVVLARCCAISSTLSAKSSKLPMSSSRASPNALFISESTSPFASCKNNSL